MTEFSDTRHLLAAGAARPIADLIEPVVEALGFRLIRVLMGGGGGRRLQIMAERADGSMSLQDCAALSRKLSAFLDEKDPIQGSYALEVSSPGIQRPLSRLEDFDRWSGHVARIELANPATLLHESGNRFRTAACQDDTPGRKRFRGRLAGVEKQCVAIEVDAADADAARLVSIPARAIARACLLEETREET